VSAQPAQRLEKILARVAREQGLDQERLITRGGPRSHFESVISITHLQRVNQP